MVKLREAILFPFSDWKRFLVGALMYLVPLLSLVTGLLAIGYVFRATREFQKGNYMLPQWTDFRGIIIEGVLAFLVSLLWFLPALIFAGAGLALLTYVMPDNTTVNAIFLVVQGILLVATSYVVPSALVRLLRTQKFRAALEWHVIILRTISARYLVNWILAFIYFIILNTVLGIVSVLLSYLGGAGDWIAFGVAGIVTFMGLLTSFALYAEGCEGVSTGYSSNGNNLKPSNADLNNAKRLKKKA